MRLFLVLALAGLAAAAAGLVLLRTALSVVVVAGPSMSPALRPGQRVLVLRRGLARLRAGRIVVVAPAGLAARGGGAVGGGLAGDGPVGGGPAGDGPAAARPVRLLVKRLAALPGEPVPPPVRPVLPAGTVPGGHVVLLGDNPDFSTDSRLWGAVPADRVVGVVLDRVRLRG
ncbi:S26 family signal peptidase [Kitasatospora sp. NPDC059146]|uniref:S26 family signal peptidase n=1 Tax=Kitasatospora sp. NPDC059146 TaxID=3346741 RepID=UPI0036B264F3